MNRLTNLTYTSSSSVLLAKYSYAANADGWRLAATEVLRQVNGTYATNQLAWGYDNLGRLTNEASSSTLTALNYTNKYVYDLAGNRLWKTNFTSAGTEIIGYTNNANDQLVKETSNMNGAFTNYYDANGSLTNRSSAIEQNVYSYNLEGKLATAVMNQQTNRYYYNQSGIRTRVETIGSVSQTNVFLNDPQNLTGFSQVLEELPTAGSTPTVSYTIGSQVIGQEKGGTVSYLQADGHGSTRLLTGVNGVISDRYTYDSYGMPLDFQPTVATPPQTKLLYIGEQFDVSLLQYYLRARYYNPTIGRFGAMDALDGSPTDPLSLHKYAYCHNDPVNGRDPSGNEDLGSLMMSIGIGVGLELLNAFPTLYVGYHAAAQVTELGSSRGTILDAASRNASPDVDTATIIIHGVGGHPNGWTTSEETPFQQDLTLEAGATPKPVGQSPPLKHDLYEFDWGGFALGNFSLIPIKSVHEMALVHLQMTQFLVSMNGYANIDIISHSWGTTLSYDLMNNSGIEVHSWVTMGSPLKQTTEKPIMNTGNWINYYSDNDPIIKLEMYPPFPSRFWIGVPLPSTLSGAGLRKDYNVDINHPAYEMHSGITEHTAYWNDYNVLTDLRKDLQ